MTATQFAQTTLALVSLLIGLACDAQESTAPARHAASNAVEEQPGANTAETAERDYVGGESCAGCHAREAELWRGSDHDLAMQTATTETLLGDFDDASLEHRGQRFSFRTEDGGFIVRTADADGAMRDFRISHTFGVDPLQQVLVPMPGGRMQALGVAWDTRPASEGGQRWFHLQPDEDVPPGDVLHWTGPAGSWNIMCADCHSTRLEKGYQPATSQYDSTWSEMNVSCEACHGPGSQHVAWAESGADPDVSGAGLGVELAVERAWQFAEGSPIAHRVPSGGSDVQIETCAPCHSRRSRIGPATGAGSKFMDDYRPALLDEGLYHADGQILDEVYVWGSFLQSRMYAAGVVCSDCHDPHRLAIEAPDQVCASCHRSDTFATPAHHHHPADSPGASCVACHMPERTYMVVDARRDHSIRVPRPDLTESIGTPNACADCHADRPTAWATEATARWYGNSRAATPHYGEILEAGRRGSVDSGSALAQLVQDPSPPAIVRASALRLLRAQMTAASVPSLLDGLADPSPLLRMAATETAEALPARERMAVLVPRLQDEVRAVRIEAARILAPLRPQIADPASKIALDSALEEYRAAQHLDADRPSAHVNLGILHMQLGELAAAEREYREAIRVGPYFLPAYVNLAEIHRMRGQDDAGERLLRDAIERFPDSADLHHTLGLLLVRSQRTDEALIALEQAATGSPENVRYAYVYGIALNSTGNPEAAVAVLEAAHRRHPGVPDLIVALATLHRDAGHRDEALDYARRLAELHPDDPGAQGLLRELEPQND